MQTILSRLVLKLLTTLAMVGAVTLLSHNAFAQELTSMDPAFARQPVAESVRLIDFERAEVRPGFLPGTFILVVSGTKPYLNMQVTLSPLVYVRQPEYWGIEVIGTLPGIGLPALAPYTVSLPLDSIRGSIGIEVIGANETQLIDLPPKADPDWTNQR
jgi:hypothetical protein